MVGIILAAGNGERLKKSSGTDGCKAWTKIHHMHLIEFALENLMQLNINKVVIVVGKQGDLIKDAIGYEYKDLEVSYVYQSNQKGLINAFVQALQVIDDSVVLQLADEIFIDLKADDVKNYINEMDCDFYCGITYEDNQEKIRNNFSVETDENSFIRKCIEKPSIVTNNIKGTGFCIFKHNVVKWLKDTYDEITNTPNDLCDFLNSLVNENKKGLAFCLAQKEFNINTLSDLEEVKAFLQN